MTDSPMPRRGLVLLDRDGTINVDCHYLDDPDRLVLCPNAGEGLRQLRGLGLGLMVITNQSAIGRGYFTVERLGQIHDRLRELTAACGAPLDAIYFCPHRAEDGCQCRKPLPGMFEQALRDFGPLPPNLFMIGDKASDIDFGRNIGATTLLVRTGYGSQTEAAGTASPDYVVDDLPAAAERIAQLLADEGVEN
ncbi:MAG: D-glycero-alpha-D-manno-heptose-1,7-bisphosphate 7-phosphatase [Pirellulales bacterium]